MSSSTARTSTTAAGSTRAAASPRSRFNTPRAARGRRLRVLGGYPATTATDNHDIEEGQAFECRLGNAVSVVAVRVLGVPSSGDDANQSFSSCGELEAFSEWAPRVIPTRTRIEGESRDHE